MCSVVVMILLSFVRQICATELVMDAKARAQGERRHREELDSAVFGKMVDFKPPILPSRNPTQSRIDFLRYQRFHSRSPLRLVMACKSDSATSASSAILIDGRMIASQVREEVKQMTQQLKNDTGIVPGLAVVLVGSRKDSATYVRNKKKMSAEVGFHNVDIALADDVTEEALLAEIAKLVQDESVHAILVQLPLPPHINEAKVLRAIPVEKDVDGFSAYNIGNLVLAGADGPLAIPCTPAGCIELLLRSGVEINGKDAVVLGRSNVVGMPAAILLQSLNATVTVCHSRTQDLKEKVRKADIVVAALGKAEMVKGDWLKPGSVVIDVGINAKDDPTRKSGYRLVGDVDFAAAAQVCSQLTPVPGGVGPMTIAMLLKNTLGLARHSLGLPRVPEKLE